MDIGAPPRVYISRFGAQLVTKAGQPKRRNESPRPASELLIPATSSAAEPGIQAEGPPSARSREWWGPWVMATASAIRGSRLAPTTSLDAGQQPL